MELKICYFFGFKTNRLCTIEGRGALQKGIIEKPLNLSVPNGFCGYEVKQGFENTPEYTQPQNLLELEIYISSHKIFLLIYVG
jgi:hypothetical protein